MNLDVKETGVEAVSDSDQLFKIIQNHKSATGSEIAQKLLSDPARLPGKFIKVIPNDYRDALASMKKPKG